MPAIYLFFKNGDTVMLGCSESEGVAGYNAIMEDATGFVDFNSGDQSVRLGIRANEIASICYNPQDAETLFSSSALSNLRKVAQQVELNTTALRPTPDRPTPKDN